MLAVLRLVLAVYLLAVLRLVLAVSMLKGRNRRTSRVWNPGKLLVVSLLAVLIMYFSDGHCEAAEEGKDMAVQDSSGVYLCRSVVNYLRHGNYIFKSEGIYLTYEHRIKIPVEFTYVSQ